MAAGRHNKNQDGVYAVRPSKTAAKRNGASVGRKHPWRPVHDGMVNCDSMQELAQFQGCERRCMDCCCEPRAQSAGRQSPATTCPSVAAQIAQWMRR